MPSIAVTNRPNAYDSAPTAGISAAAVTNRCFHTAAGTRVRALDTAGPLGVPSTRTRGIASVTRAVTTATLSRRNRHNPSTIIAVTAPVSTRRRPPPSIDVSGLRLRLSDQFRGGQYRPQPAGHPLIQHT